MFASRNSLIVATVLLLHGAALWALQSGLVRRIADLVVPAEFIVEMAAPENAAPVEAPAHMEQQASPERPRPQVVQAPPAPLAVEPASPIVADQVDVPATTMATSSSSTSNARASAPSPGVAGPPALVLPSSDADYLNNPSPAYPALSKRLREQGKVVVRTLIGADGVAQLAEIKQSSGYDRLDEAARAAALRWRYVPGKRAGVPEAMWFNLPFNFVLE